MTKNLKCYNCLCSADTLRNYDGIEMCSACIDERKSKENN